MLCQALLQICVVGTEMLTLMTGKSGVNSCVTASLPPGGKDSCAVFAAIHDGGSSEQN